MMRHYPGDDRGVFLTVCETGSFTAAAGLLGLTPSAVTKSITRLEARLKVALFTRTTRRIAMTPQGLVYRDACRTARNEIERVETHLASLSVEPTGRLSVSVPPLLGAIIVTPALLGLCRTWPQLSISISSSIEPADLFDGTVDLAVRVGELPDSAGLVAKKLGMQRVVLCGSTDYFSQHARPRNIEDLSAHHLIGNLHRGQVAAWRFQVAADKSIPFKPDTQLVLEGAQLTLSAIKAGYGLGMVPYWLVKEDIDNHRLISVLEDKVVGHLPIHALWPAAETQLPRLRVVIDTLAATTATYFR